MDIAGVVYNVADVLELPAGLHVVCEGRMPVVHTHRMPIEVVLKQFVTDRVQHHDRPRGRVTVSMRLLDDVVGFRVDDDKPGISRRFHRRRFANISSLQPCDDMGRAGVGLTMVKKPVEHSGGQLLVESDPPAQGATFILHLGNNLQ